MEPLKPYQQPNNPPQRSFTQFEREDHKLLHPPTPGFRPEETFAPDFDLHDDLIAALNPRQPLIKPDQDFKLKHIFEIKVIEINVPILTKIL